MLVKIRTRAIIVLLVFAASAAYVVGLPVRADASVLDTFRDTSLLFLKETKSSGQSFNQSSTGNSGNKSTTSSPSPAASSIPQPTPTPAAIEIVPIIDAAELQKVHFAETIEPFTWTTSRRTAVAAGAPLSSIPLQASSKGWEFLGLAWYWWVIEAALIGMGVVVWRKGVTQHLAAP